jgi:hypothetical protein
MAQTLALLVPRGRKFLLNFYNFLGLLFATF